MKEKRIMEGLIDKRSIGPIYKISGSRIAVTPNFETLQNWVKKEIKEGIITHNREILVSYEETRLVGLTQDFPVAVDGVKVFTAMQLAEIKFEEILQKA